MSQANTKKIVCGLIAAALIVGGGIAATTTSRPAAVSPNATTQASTKANKTAPKQEKQAEPAGSHVTVAFNFAPTSTKGSDQFAVWVEDSNGKFVRTLYVTKYASTKGVNKSSDCLPTWGEHSGIKGSKNIDIATGATPANGKVQYYWDLTDTQGNPVAPGTYTLYVEATQGKGQQILYRSPITVGSAAATATAEASYTGGQPEKPIVGPATITYAP